MRRVSCLALAAILLVGCGGAAGPTAADGPDAMLAALSQAARRGDQAGVDALLDKGRVAATLQAQNDQLTGYGRWLKRPDSACAAWRPTMPRRRINPDRPLAAAELAGWLGHGPGALSSQRSEDGTVHVIIPFGVTEAGLELTERAGGWVVTGVWAPTEVPPPPQFECLEPRDG